MQKVPVYAWLMGEEEIGCGTQVEFDHWSAEGTLIGVTRGPVLCYEPASEDARRMAAWAKVAA